ncbi:MAG: HtrA protease/chaperone protein [Myxococcaceae bacterium]|nr:HtrA protease/chaperone protein [Myxococcaceae bacterium]
MPSALNSVAAQAAESIVLLQFGKAYGIGFLASGDGLVVTSLHVVMGEKKVTAHLADGRKIDVRQVGGLDTKRDLAVLKLEVPGLPSLPRGPKRLVEEGTPVIVFGMVEQGQRTRWAPAKISAVQVLGGWLTIYRLEGELPADASGGPLVSATGEVLGVVTVAQTEEGTAVLGVPLKYVTPMLDERVFRPLTALAPPKRAPAARREIPEHPITILEGSSASGLEVMMESIASAISIGAPAYNQGNIEACYQVYRETARRLIATHQNCPGPRRALEQGLRRAAAMKDVDARAWAMRDAFDGLMAVMEKFFKSHGSAMKKAKVNPKLLN